MVVNLIFWLVFIISVLLLMRLYKLTVRPYDPVVSCEVYIKEGCAHVDGFLCNMKTCTMLKEYRGSRSGLVKVNEKGYFYIDIEEQLSDVEEPNSAKITDTDRYEWLCKNRGYSNKDIDNMIMSERKFGV